VDESDLDRLGIKGVGDSAEINRQNVKVVGLVKGFVGTAGAHVFCSIDTARSLFSFRPNQASFILGRCFNPGDAGAVVKRLHEEHPEFSAFTAPQLSRRSRNYWLIQTKGGLALGYAAILGLLVGAVVTSQTLYGATMAQIREYAVLWALGIPVRRMAALVLAQAFWVGVSGTVLALPAIFVIAGTAHLIRLVVLLPFWLLAGTALITLVMALGSGLTALRSLRRLEPANLLR
jgi:putative ABC transport system permease protein